MVRFLALAALALASFTASSSRSVAFDGLVVFGDSLSDTGNAGRFTNGEVWVEVLAARLGLSSEPSSAGGSNFAIGGARLDPASGPTSIPAQVRRYLDARADPDGRLFAVYGGGNDLIAAALSPLEEAMVATALSALEGALADLAEAGARDILVPNLPDIAMIPAARGQNQITRSRYQRAELRELLLQELGQVFGSEGGAVQLEGHPCRSTRPRPRRSASPSTSLRRTR